MATAGAGGDLQPLMALALACFGAVTTSLSSGMTRSRESWGRDQPGVAARAERLGVARVLARDSLNAEIVEAALQAVMSDPAFRDASLTHSSRLRQSDPVADAIEAVESV